MHRRVVRHPEDVEECVRSLPELQCPEFSFEIVKKVISKALDRRAKECELASVIVIGLDAETARSETSREDLKDCLKLSTI